MTTDISVVRWDPSQGNGEYIDEYEYDGGNSSSRLFERSRIKALAGEYFRDTYLRFKCTKLYLRGNVYIIYNAFLKKLLVQNGLHSLYDYFNLLLLID